ncbi:MAG: DUF1836 domain-containing protein [Oscillospiraceae bacterium]|nr:DUF1836 domain-containing protein [Oscillospiraceae bacterium]
MTENIQELRVRLETQRPGEWDSLPDLSLYMDQTVGYMARQLIGGSPEEKLTSAMVNNYIKDGHLPRAEGKRYSKTHLAYLTQLCALKTVLPVKDAGFLVNRAGEGDIETRYEAFRQALDGALKDTAERLPTHCETQDLPVLAMDLALRSYANKLACQRLIAMLREAEPEPAGKQKKNKKADKA